MMGPVIPISRWTRKAVRQLRPVANATAAFVRTADEVRQALLVQMYSPVRWEESIRLLCADGADTFIEVGPGRVLTGLVRKINRSAGVYFMDDAAFLEKGLAEIKGVA